MTDGVRELRTPRRLQVREQIELAAVVGPVTTATERYATRRVATPAERARDEVRRIDPAFELDRDYPEARFYEALLHYGQQHYDRVIQCLSLSDFPFDIGLLAAAYARKGSELGARQCIEKLSRLAQNQYVTPLAEAFAAIGMKHFDLAFQRLNEAIDDKTAFVNLLAVEPLFNPLRHDGRFAKLLKKLNLPTLNLP